MRSRKTKRRAGRPTPIRACPAVGADGSSSRCAGWSARRVGRPRLTCSGRRGRNAWRARAPDGGRPHERRDWGGWLSSCRRRRLRRARWSLSSATIGALSPRRNRSSGTPTGRVCATTPGVSIAHRRRNERRRRRGGRPRWRRVEARNADRGRTYQLPFDVTREMFDFVETMWEAPTAAEMTRYDGIRIGA